MLISLLLTSILQFGSPVNYPVSLAGNFGEPRPNHFHGGIDVRTGMAVGKPIFSVADGYVCRITVGMYGFGNALYVRHPNGITSVYCHLKKFVPQLTAIMRKWQYKHKTCYADVRLRPTDYPVAIGQLIAVSGNSGASLAPHLHLEFHDTKTWSFLDPLQYLKDFVADTTQPIAHAFMAYPIEGEGIFCGSQRKQSCGFSSSTLTRKFTAWGKVGFGLWANDYMDGSFGILGVHHAKLTVDGKIVFESDVDSIPFAHNRMVNSWGDYEHHNRANVWYMKSFVEPGNMLPVLHTSSNRGVINFNEERDYQLVYTVSDIFGNMRNYSFAVHGKRQHIQPKRIDNMLNLLRYDRMNCWQRPGVSLQIGRGLLPDDIELSPKVVFKTEALSDEWSFYKMSYPLFNWATISLRLKGKVEDTSKLYIVCHYGSERYMGGVYQDGWVTGKIRELGARYEIGYDDVPPIVSGFSANGRQIRVSAYDNKSGLRSVQGYVDGQFVLFEYIEKTCSYVCDIKNSPILLKKGALHDLKFIAIDNRNNKKEFMAKFKY